MAKRKEKPGTAAVRRNISEIIETQFTSQQAFASRVGVTQGVVSQWLNGGCPGMESMTKIADSLGLTIEDIVSESNGYYAKRHNANGTPPWAVFPSSSHRATLPLVGRGHAGKPGDPDEMDGVVELPASVAAGHPKAYFLEVEGDCMDRVYPEGCYILVDPDREPQDGSVAVFSIEGMGYVIRRLKTAAKRILLVPESFNDEHDDIVITDNDERTVEAVGTVVWFQAKKEMD